MNATPNATPTTPLGECVEQVYDADAAPLRSRGRRGVVIDGDDDATQARTTILSNRRRVYGAVCPDCHAATLVGLDADTCALTVIVDVHPLTRSGELLAVIGGRVVYEFDRDCRLHRRDQWRIRSAATSTVLASHVCGHPIPDDWRLPPAPRPTPTPEEPW